MVLGRRFESLMKPGGSCKLSQQIRDLCKMTHGESEHSQALHMPSEFIVVAPLVNSQSLFDLYAVLPAERPKDPSSSFSFPFKSHILSSRAQGP